MYRRLPTSWIKHWDFILLDLVCLQVGFVLSYWLRFGVGENPYFLTVYRSVAVLIEVFDLVVLIMYGTLSGVRRRGKLAEFTATAKSNVLLLAATTVYLYGTKTGSLYSRVTFFMTIVIYSVLTYVVRCLWKWVLNRTRRDRATRSLLILTTADMAEETVQNIEKNEYNRVRIEGLAILDKNMAGEEIAGVPVAADADSVEEYICREWVDEVFVRLPGGMLQVTGTPAAAANTAGPAAGANPAGAAEGAAGSKNENSSAAAANTAGPAAGKANIDAAADTAAAERAAQGATANTANMAAGSKNGNGSAADTNTVSPAAADTAAYAAASETLQDKLSRIAETGVVIHLNLAESDVLSGRRQMVQRLGSYPVLTASVNTMSMRQAVFKRTMDIAGGLVGCLITCVLFVILAPVIYCKSPGPIFFAQTRIGKNGRPFKMYKFRSMYLDAEERKAALMEQNRVKDGMMFKMDFDPRVIGNRILPDGTQKRGIGDFIRRTSLDEFPQFFNVLKGEMSLVGTRPPTPDEWEKYELHHRARLAVKPGITGMWQVSGRSSILDFEEVVRLDMRYIEEWNLGLDIKILWKTVCKFFGGDDGAM